MAFSPDGRWLVSSGNGNIQVWPLNISDLITEACSRVSRNLTQVEWDTFFGQNVTYKPTCDNLPYHPTVLEAMVEQGKGLARQDKIKEALALWKKVTELDPDMAVDMDALLAEIYLEKGYEYVQAGDYDQALDILRKAIEIDLSLDFKPETRIAEMLVNVASQYASAGDYDTAVQSLGRVIEFDPTFDFKIAQGETVEGEVDTRGSDLWTYEGTSGQSISIRLNDIGDGLDCYLILLSSSGEIMTNDDFDGTDSRIDYDIMETGTYLIVAGGYGGSTGAYALTVTNP